MVGGRDGGREGEGGEWEGRGRREGRREGGNPDLHSLHPALPHCLPLILFKTLECIQ